MAGDTFSKIKKGMKSTCSRFRFATHGNSILLRAFFALVLAYPGSRALAALPDLIVDRPRLARTIVFEKKTFNDGDCAVVEGCVTGTGERRLMRFAVGFVNMGQGHLWLGKPENHPELFQYSPCHQHYHFSSAAHYVLRRRDGTKAAGGRKQAFCLLDTIKYVSSAGPAKFTCDYQGLSRGWGDVYYRNLDCQWLDITGVPAGNYNLVVTVNPLHVLRESSYDNNSASVPVYIPPNR